MAIAIVWTTTVGIGLFASPDTQASGRVPAAQAGLLAVSLCALVLAALFAERRRHELALEKSEERLRLAVAASHMGMFDWDLRTGTFLWSDEWYRMLGYEVGDVEPSQAAWMARIHPDDRETANTSRESATRDHREFSSAYRIVRPDGAIRWIQSHGRFLFEAGIPVRLIGLKQDITESRHLVETQRVLVAELQHRTRNLMAVVQSIAYRTLDTADSLADFESRFNHRLEALSRVQGILSRADNEPITLGALVGMEFEAFGFDAFGSKSTFVGPEARLPKSAVEMLSLAIHELLTNAIKYGALASETGRLSVTWSIEGTSPNQQLVLEWTERGIVRSPQAADAGRIGYGHTFIEEALPYSLSAETEFHLGSDTLVCLIRLPFAANGVDEMPA